MMKILVPIDFSNASFVTYCYANNLAYALGAQITLMHILSDKMNMSAYLDGDLPLHMKDVSKDRLLDFAIKYPKEKGIQIKKVETNYLVGCGDPREEIIKATAAMGYDIIVMGIPDKINIIPCPIGTKATEIMSESGIPVIMVHR